MQANRREEPEALGARRPKHIVGNWTLDHNRKYASSITTTICTSKKI